MKDENHLRSENNDIEYKEAKDKIPRGFWESFSAFANTHGGTIILGIKEQNKRYEITGVSSPEKMVTDLWNDLGNPQKISSCHLTDDDITIEDKDGKKIILVHVPEATRRMKPVFMNNNMNTGTFVRMHDGDHHCDRKRLNEMIRDSEDVPSDDTPLIKIPISAINQDTVKRYRSRFADNNPGSPYNQIDDVSFLKMIGAVDDVDGVPHPTKAGAVMFCKGHYIVKEYPWFFLDCRRFLDDGPDWSDRISSLRPDNGDNVFDFYDMATKMVWSALPEALEFDSDLKSRSSTHLRLAVRELMTNALLHADYHGEMGVVIDVRPNCVTISNPGHFRIPVTEAKRGGKSNPRNPTLFRMFGLIGAIERAGTGVNRSMLELVDSGLREPEFIEEEDPSRTTICIFLERKKENIEEAIFDVISKDGEKSIDDISKMTHIPRSTVYRNLQKLSDSGRIVRCGAKKNGYWKVVER